MTYLLALDPGYKQSGIALFKDESLCYGALIECTPPPIGLAQQAANIAGTASLIARKHNPDGCDLDTAVELMQIDDRTGKAQARELLRLSTIAGAVSTLGTLSYSYAPSEWNKNRPKGPNHAKILRALTDREKDDLLVEAKKITDGESKSLFKSLRPQITDVHTLYDRAVDERTGQAEHVLDAIGIGLYHLGRLR